MATPRKPTVPTTDAIDAFCAQFDDLCNRRAARQAFRHYLMGLLLPREHNKTMTVLASLVPGSVRQRLHHFLHDAPWDAQALNRRRLQLWQEHPTLAPHRRATLIVDETGDRKRGHSIPFAAQQDIGKVGFTANGVVSVNSQWTDETHHIPLGVKPYWPASRLPEGKKDPRFRTKPELAWELIAEAWSSGTPFAVVVGDCIYGENATLEGKLFTTGIPSILAIHSHHGVWQFVEDEAHPPAFNPREAAERLPPEQWQQVVRQDSHGKELVHDVAELEMGNAYGPRKAVRLIAATTNPTKLKKDATWYLITNIPLHEASAQEVYQRYCLRDGVEHYDKPAKHELGWADFQTRDPEATVRHWQLVMLAYTFSLYYGAPPPGWVRTEEEQEQGAVVGGENQANGSCGRRRCGGSGAGCVPGRPSPATGVAGPNCHRLRNRQPCWRTWRTLNPLMPQPDQPATSSPVESSRRSARCAATPQSC